MTSIQLLNIRCALRILEDNLNKETFNPLHYTNGYGEILARLVKMRLGDSKEFPAFNAGQKIIADILGLTDADTNWLCYRRRILQEVDYFILCLDRPAVTGYDRGGFNSDGYHHYDRLNRFGYSEAGFNEKGYDFYGNYNPDHDDSPVYQRKS
jgi:hypothetical protein